MYFYETMKNKGIKRRIRKYASLGVLLRISKKTACQLFQPLKYKATVERKGLYDEPLKQLEREKKWKKYFSTFLFVYWIRPLA